MGEGSRFDGVVGRPAVRGTWGGRGPGLRWGRVDERRRRREGLRKGVVDASGILDFGEQRWCDVSGVKLFRQPRVLSDEFGDVRLCVNGVVGLNRLRGRGEMGTLCWPVLGASWCPFPRLTSKDACDATADSLPHPRPWPS